MGRPDPKAVPENLVAFGANVYACAEIIGSSIDSVALRTDIKTRIFNEFIAGEGYLSNDIIEAVCAEFRLDESKMCAHFDTPDQRMLVLERQLKSAGFITSSTMLGGTARKVPPLIAEIPTEPLGFLEVPAIEDEVREEQVPDADTVNATREEPMADETLVEETNEVKVIWEEDDLTANAITGEHFNLRSKELRASIIARIREVLSRIEMTFATLNNLTNLKKNSSWWRNVETSQNRIYGTELECIAEKLEVSVFSLLQPDKAAPAADTVADEPPVTEPVIQQPELPTEPDGPVVEPAHAAEAAAPEQAAPQVATMDDIMLEEAREQTPAFEREYFRRLVLRADTQPAPDATFGQLLELARDQEGVDWKSAYLTLTLAGHDLSQWIADLKARLALHEEPIQRLFLEGIKPSKSA